MVVRFREHVDDRLPDGCSGLYHRTIEYITSRWMK
ncbi:hypothetical protein D8S78_00370 [Natrialba swarupiae]|nr:hypothetical protein [Natrialba swarupiae]